jgi:hypothetical protein
LRLAHGASPRSFQLIVLHVAAVEDGQGVEQFAAKQSAAPIVIRQRRQRRNHGPHAAEPAEVRLEPPHRHLDARLDRVRRGHALREARVLLQPPLRGANGVAAKAPPQVGGKVEREFGLLPIALEHDRHGLEAGQCDVERRRLDAAGERVGPHRLQPVGKGRQRRDRGVLSLVRRARRRPSDNHKKDRNAPSPCTCHPGA